jgi:FkbM family methyltransferase
MWPKSMWLKPAPRLDESRIVSSLYRAILDRDPDAQELVSQIKSLRESGLDALVREFLQSIEFQRVMRASPLWTHINSLWRYTAIFDPVQIILAHENRKRTALPGHRVNYLGVAVNVTRFVPELKLENIVEGPPIPGNWHTDLAEMGAVLRAVDRAADSFAMVELGCGWGCWMSISATAARLAGKTAHVTGVEGDEGHLDFAREAMATNDIAPSQYNLIHGVATARTGRAFFPLQEHAGIHWGLEPIFAGSLDELERLRGSGGYSEVVTVSIEEVIGNRPRLDLLHVDIQGGETSLIRDSLDVLNRKVAYIVVGTHSRAIDGQIIDILSRDGGWRLEIERPCIFSIEDGTLLTRIDGLQGWRNTRM